MYGCPISADRICHGNMTMTLHFDSLLYTAAAFHNSRQFLLELCSQYWMTHQGNHMNSLEISVSLLKNSSLSFHCRATQLVTFVSILKPQPSFLLSHQFHFLTLGQLPFFHQDFDNHKDASFETFQNKSSITGPKPMTVFTLTHFLWGCVCVWAFQSSL